MPRFVIFSDALDPVDVALGSPYLNENMYAKYKASTPIVTPNNVSQAMIADIREDIKDANIGARQEDLPFTRSTPYKEARFGGTKEKTILHYASEVKELKTFCWGIPLVTNCVLPQGSIVCHDPLGKGQQQVPAPFVFLHGKADYSKDDPELIFHQHIDGLAAMFATVRTLARNDEYDVIFIGIHETDVYAHWYDENKIRQIQFIGNEIKDLSRYGPVFIWSDHGATKQREDSPFFINRFLREKGWLDYTINQELMNDNNPNKWKVPKFPDSLPLGSPFVKINWRKTKFFCADAFDSMVDCTYRASNRDREKLREQLMATGYYDSVAFKREIFDTEGQYYKKTPDILPETSNGVNVSCNIHPKAETGINMCRARRGWHSNRACSILIGDELTAEINQMRDVYTAMKEFIDKQEPLANQKEEGYEFMEELAHDLMY